MGSSILGVAAVALIEPDDGPVGDLIERAESHVPDGLIYRVHMALGSLFSICPCTAELSAAEYEKAAFHRP
jgi:hypothetical protein